MRMGNKSRKFPLILVNAEKNEEGKKLYDIESIGNVKVQAEAKRRQSEARKCYRCQQFGHVSYRCNLSPKFLKCAGAHWSRECNHQGTGKCTNCKGNHFASSWSCPAHPKIIQEARQQRKNMLIQQAYIKPNISYANVAGGSNNNADEDLERRIKDILEKVLPTIIKNLNG